MSGFTLNPPQRLRMLYALIPVAMLHVWLGAYWQRQSETVPPQAEPVAAVEISIAMPAPVSRPEMAAPAIRTPEPVIRPRQEKIPEEKKQKPKPKAIPKPAQATEPDQKVSEMREKSAKTEASNTSSTTEASQAAAPSPAPVSPAPVAATQPSFHAAYLHNPPPVYPPMARSRGWEGRVIVKVLVSAEGHASEVHVEQSSEHDSLDEAALEAIRQWHFVPATRVGKPVQAWVLVPMDFRLSR